MKVSTVFALTLLCTALGPVTAKADAQQDQDACMVDAQTFCGQFIPDRERVAQCLMTNRSRISPACRVALKHFK